MIDGWTKYYRLNSSGEEAVIHVFTKGDSFAKAAALTGARFPATAEAVTDARVVQVPADHIIKCIREDPNIALGMIASMSQRMYLLMQQVEQLKAQSGVQRVAEFLASLAPVHGGPCVIALPYDKALIAARLGLTPSSLSRTFAKLRSVGVAVRAADVAVGDVAKLRRLAKDDKSTISRTLENSTCSSITEGAAKPHAASRPNSFTPPARRSNGVALVNRADSPTH